MGRSLTTLHQEHPLLIEWVARVMSEFGPPRPMTRLVLLTLGFNMTNPAAPLCRLSIREISDMTALCDRSVVSHLKFAAVDGWIKRSIWRTNTQGWRCFQYEPLLSKTIFEADTSKSDALAAQSRSHKLVSLALKSGRLARLPCETCANPDAEAHHDDYTKPLDVRWLCRLHHVMFHVKQRAAARASRQAA